VAPFGVEFRCGIHGFGISVAIYRLLQQSAFGPEDIQRMTTAYEDALRTLKMERTDPKTERLAKAIIEITQTGIRDPEKICALAVEDFSLQ
jgi:hypothetical protein